MSAIEGVQRIHLLGTLTLRLTESYSQVFKWGNEVDVTDNMVELSRDRNGDTFMDLLDDEDGQVARWGKVMFGPGPFPAHLPPAEPGSPEAETAREFARRAAWAEPDPAARKEALAKVDAVYGKSTPFNKNRWVWEAEEVRTD